MKWVGTSMLVLLLALPASRGDDPPKDKDGKKDPSVKEQYQALVKEFNAKRSEIATELRKTKGEEQQKLLAKYNSFGKEFADKFYKLAEDNPKDPVGTDALFWIVQNATGSALHAKATDQVTTLIGQMPIKDLNTRLNTIQASPTILTAVLKRADKDEKDPLSGDLVAWAATRAYFLPGGEKAITRLVEKYPDHAAIERVCAVLGQGRVDNADVLLKSILEKAGKPKVKAAAALGLGKVLASKTDDLGDKPAEADKVAAEGEKYLTMAIDLLKDSEAQRKEAEQELKSLRTLRVGKPAPEIKAGDLDGKEFTLADYKGKVVLLDFWGNW